MRWEPTENTHDTLVLNGRQRKIYSDSKVFTKEVTLSQPPTGSSTSQAALRLMGDLRPATVTVLSALGLGERGGVSSPPGTC